MEKNIKEAMQRQILSTELLNDNALLVLSKKPNFPYTTLSVCYIEEEKNALVEDRICFYEDASSVEYNDRMVAVTYPNGTKPRQIYDLEHKEFVTGDFLTVVYNSRINKKQFVYKAK